MKKSIITAIVLLLCISLGFCVFFRKCTSETSRTSDLTSSDTDATKSTISTTETTTTSKTVQSDDSGKVYIEENTELTKESAEHLIKNLIYSEYSEKELIETETKPNTYIVQDSSKIENQSIKNLLRNYISNSSSSIYYSNISDYGTYCSITGLTEKEIVLFEMDNKHIAISEPESDITDYSMKYPFLFTIRNSDSTTAYYWCAQEKNDWVSYASHHIVRVWIYNTEQNSYSCIKEAE